MFIVVNIMLIITRSRECEGKCVSHMTHVVEKPVPSRGVTRNFIWGGYKFEGLVIAISKHMLMSDFMKITA